MRKPIAALVAGVVCSRRGRHWVSVFAGDPQGMNTRARETVAWSSPRRCSLRRLRGAGRALPRSRAGTGRPVRPARHRRHGLQGGRRGHVCRRRDGGRCSRGRAGGGAGATGTNVQEVGVDEPDIVKTNGELILVVANNRLQVVAPGPSPNVEGVGPAYRVAAELLINGDRALVLTRGTAGSCPSADGKSHQPGRRWPAC